MVFSEVAYYGTYLSLDSVYACCNCPQCNIQSRTAAVSIFGHFYESHPQLHKQPFCLKRKLTTKSIVSNFSTVALLDQFQSIHANCFMAVFLITFQTSSSVYSKAIYVYYLSRPKI